MILLEAEEDTQTIEVREEDGKKIIIVDGEEVSREDFGKEGKAQKIFVKMIETDEDPDMEVEIREIRVTEDGEEHIIEISPEGDENVRFRAITIDADKNVDINNKDAKFVFYRSGEEPLIFIDGKKASKKKMDKLDPDQIESINVLKGDKALEKYGKKAADGVIEITTKNQ
jgi:TonB-dependent SusC/RagA subfamily outer membrane receptor